MKIFSNKGDKIVIFAILLTLIFFAGIKPYFLKTDQQEVEALEEDEPLVLTWLPYNEGLLKAEKESKYVLIYFYTNECGWCKKMDKETYSNEEVQKILSDKFVAIKINAKSENKVVEKGKKISERELAIMYQVSGYPTTWFLESNHDWIAPLPGYAAAEQFIKVIKYIGEGWYESISFEEYLKKNAN